MAKKTITVSDLSNKEIADPKEAVTITVKYGDKVIVVQVVVTHNPAMPSTLTSKERL